MKGMVEHAERMMEHSRYLVKGVRMYTFKYAACHANKKEGNWSMNGHFHVTVCVEALCMLIP